MDEELTEADLEAIEARVRAASPGPWRSWVEGRDHYAGNSVITTGGGDIELLTFGTEDPTRPDRGQSNADQDFIAHARQDVPRLLGEVRRLRALLGRT